MPTNVLRISAFVSRARREFEDSPVEQRELDSVFRQAWEKILRLQRPFVSLFRYVTTMRKRHKGGEFTQELAKVRDTGFAGKEGSETSVCVSPALIVVVRKTAVLTIVT